MRLTLRTLLSYLDDTLEPAQTRLIGEKVTESEIAPELIERIKKVTRRRGLAAPAVSGDFDDSSADPNTVAEYLDNALSAEQVAELEQAALESDAALAEVASCHQILTLVLGEPAKVPPTSRQNMYRIVKGREAVHYRRAATIANVAGVADPSEPGEDAEADDALLLGLSGSRLFVPIVSAAVIALLLVTVIWLAIPSPKPVARQGYISTAMTIDQELLPLPKLDVAEKKEPPKIAADQPKVDHEANAKVVDNPKPKVEDKPKPKPDDEPKKADDGPKKADGLRPIVAPPVKPDPERRAIARLESKDFLLLAGKRDTGEWERAAPNKDLFSTDTLLSLPGNHNEIKLQSGVRLSLFGTMPEYHRIEQLDVMESKLILHVPPLGIDADFTLESGRVFITHPTAKGEKFEPVRVRVRFKEEVWDVTLLDPNTEVGIDLTGYYGEGVPFSLEPGGPAPTSEVLFGLLSGRAGLKLKFQEYPALTAPTRVDWNSAFQERSEPIRIKEKELEVWNKWWSKTADPNEFAKQLQSAAAHYANRFNNSKPDEARIDVAFYSAIEDPMEQPARRVFALRCLQALDAPEYFTNALSDDVLPMRQLAIRCVQHWTGLSPERDLILYKLLVNKKSYTEAQAQAVLQLLHPFAQADYEKLEIVAALFEALKNEKIAVRELAYKHLAFCDPKGAVEVGLFDVAAPAEARDAIIQKWKASWKKRFIDKK